MTWRLAPDGDHLLRDGVDDFFLADTWWAALHRAPDDQFERALKLRASQGFSGLMMSLLPISHDASGEVAHPFASRSDGTPDFDRLDEAWLARASSMVARVVERGLTPMLMLQWVNYVPGTWASQERPELVMTDAQTVRYLDQVIPAFLPHSPLWSLSGDDIFATRASIDRYALIAGVLRRHDPRGLVTAHTGGYVSLPDEVLALTDFIGFQSGHDGANWGDNPANWNRYLSCIGARQPRMNLEPPYEGHGYNNGEGRYDARRVRVASWRSVLSGAGAGLGYGAHGLWSWHREGEPFSSEGWSGMPFDAMTTLDFPGPRDVAYLRRLVIEHRLWRLMDRSDLVVRDISGVRVGGSRNLDLVVVHAPHAFSFEVQVDDADYDVIGYDLDAQTQIDVPRSVGGSGRIVIDTPHENAEHLYVLTPNDRERSEPDRSEQGGAAAKPHPPG